MVIKLACVFVRSKSEQYRRAIKEFLPFAAFPILFFVFIMPGLVFDIHFAVNSTLDTALSSAAFCVHISVEPGFRCDPDCPHLGGQVLCEEKGTQLENGSRCSQFKLLDIYLKLTLHCMCALQIRIRMHYNYPYTHALQLNVYNLDSRIDLLRMFETIKITDFMRVSISVNYLTSRCSCGCLQVLFRVLLPRYWKLKGSV